MLITFQSADYSTIERPDLDCDAALDAFRSHDWSAALQAVDFSDEAKDCPPGILLSYPLSQTVLHICPETTETARAFYMYVKKRRVLGILPFYSHKSHEISQCTFAEAEALIRHHYADDQQAILNF